MRMVANDGNNLRTPEICLVLLFSAETNAWDFRSAYHGQARAQGTALHLFSSIFFLFSSLFFGINALLPTSLTILNATVKTY